MNPSLLLLAATHAAWAADPLLETRAAADGVEPEAPEAASGLTFLGLVQVRPTATNIVTTNPLLDGQIIGELGGGNGTTTLDPGVSDLDGDGEPDLDAANSVFTEQRLSAFLSYAPPLLDGRATLHTGFEIDFAYGDAAYGVGGNVGGGYGADQVNLQTRRLNAELVPVRRDNHVVELVVGLQFLADGATNPTKAAPDDLFRAGGGLRFFGSEAAGFSVFGRAKDEAGERLRYRLGTYTLYEGGLGREDDVGLHMADVQLTPAWRTQVGLHAWALRDRTGGDAGVLGSGPTSTLSDWQGGPQLDFRQSEDDLAPAVNSEFTTIALDAGFNHRLDQGPLGLTALVAGQVGKIVLEGREDPSIQGWHLDAEARYRYWRGGGSVLTLGATASSRDGTGPDSYTGVLTGNSYGIVGAVWGTTGCVLLFPDPSAINRQVSIVGDIANGGDGLVALHGSVGFDPVPDKLTVTVGGGTARDQLGKALGTELNGRLTWEPLFMLKAGAVLATVSGSDLPKDPWMALGTLEWVVF